MKTFCIQMVCVGFVLFHMGGCRQRTIIADERLIEGTESVTDTESNTATTTDSASDSQSDTASDTGDNCGIPNEFSWTSTPALLTPPDGADRIKDPTVVFYGNSWHVYGTLGFPGEILSMAYVNVTDWNQASTAEVVPVKTNPNLLGYKAAPQLFYFAPKDRWYLVYQTPAPAYSTSTNPGDVSSWSEMQLFMDTPTSIKDAEKGGIDYWVICDDTDCYLFFSALDDVLYRAKTARAEFPEGFADSTHVVMEGATAFSLYDSCNVYKIKGTNRYLLLVSAIGTMGRYYRSWTAETLDGSWTPLATTEDDAFASANNVGEENWSMDTPPFFI